MSMNEIRSVLASMASKQKKPSKTQAQAVLCEIAKEHPELYSDLAQLYTYFRPPMPRKPRTVFEWVAKAAGKDDPRYYLNFVYATDMWITATDGSRMHRAPNTENLEPGYYLPTGEKDDSIAAQYPDIDRIVPRDTPHCLSSEAIKGAELTVTGSGSNELTAAGLVFGDTTAYVNERFLKDVLSYGDEVAAYNEGRPSTAVRFDFLDGRQAVIMPIRV